MLVLLIINLERRFNTVLLNNSWTFFLSNHFYRIIEAKTIINRIMPESDLHNFTTITQTIFWNHWLLDKLASIHQKPRNYIVKKYSKFICMTIHRTKTNSEQNFSAKCWQFYFQKLNASQFTASQAMPQSCDSFIDELAFNLNFACHSNK